MNSNYNYNQRHNAVVDQTIEWQPLETCRPGAKVLLLTDGNVAILGSYRPGDPGIKGWSPLPNIPEWMK